MAMKVHPTMLLVMIWWSLVALTQTKSLVLIGGGLSDGNTEIWSKIIDLAGGQGVARIGIITAASADPIDSAAYYIAMLNLYGANDTYFIPVYEGNEEANSDPEVINNILRMTGFVFGGGDQARIINCFYDNTDGRVESPALTAIRNVYDNGGMISGISAGLAAQPWTYMIMGGVSYDALLNGAFAYGEQTKPDDLIYDPLGGIEMLDTYAVDSHFSERGREGRLIRILSDTRALSRGVHYGFGVDEDTALVVYNVSTTQAIGEVVGRAGVLLLDLSSSSLDTAAEYFTIRRITGHYLTHGDRIDMTTREVQFDGTWKVDLTGSESNQFALTSEDIFGGLVEAGGKPEFVRVSTSLFDAQLDTVARGETAERNPKFAVTFTKDSTISRGFGGYSPVTGRWEISYRDLFIDVEEA